MSDPDKAVFHWELCKLLLQVAWADDSVHPAERRLILGLGERLSVGPERQAELERHLDGRSSLPPPNLTLLRSRKDEVIQAAEQLVMADDEIDDAENELLAELHELLSERPPPAPTGGQSDGDDEP